MRDVRRHVINAKRSLALLRRNCPTRLLGVGVPSCSDSSAPLPLVRPQVAVPVE